MKLPTIRVTILFLALCSLRLAAGTDETTIISIPSLSSACSDITNSGQEFSIEGNVVSYYRRPITGEWIISISQGTNSITVYEYNKTDTPATTYPNIALNDRTQLDGILYKYQDRPVLYPGYKVARLITRAPFPNENPVPPHELTKDECRGQLFRVRGIVRDAYRDESDPQFVFMTLRCGTEILFIMVLHRTEEPFNPNDFIGSEVIASGVCNTSNSTLRRHLGPILSVSGLENISIVRKSDFTDARIPDIHSLQRARASDFSSLGWHQAIGTIIATWHKDQALLRTHANEIIRLYFSNSPVPSCGKTIRAVGFPETDLYFLNLRNASWSLISDGCSETNSALNATADGLLTDGNGNRKISIPTHGRLIRMSGAISHLSRPSDQDSRIHLESDGHLIPVDASSCPNALDDLTIGTRISVTGVCVIDIDATDLNISTPKAKGAFLVIRTPDDLVVLSRPSWWTPVRLLIVIGALILLIAAILVWNVTLRRLAERRGRELADEQVNRAVSDLKVYERTHLAVELHDSLSQTLSGVSMQIDAVGRFADTDRERMHKHLGIAAKTLKSCRDELRNCLTDLRSNALEERDMNEAIRQTLEPYSDDAAISIRFFIPREILSDSTAHTILRIIRELVVNAIRHGHADKVRVAGTLENGKLLFSVSDNGCGFDVTSAPGLAEGHFGLQGIRERVDGLDGNFEIESKAGQGSKATVSIVLPSPLNEEKT